MDISGIAAVDVFIGLAFLYVLLSTGCSAINEAIASWMNWRAKELLKGIANLLGDDPPPKPSAGNKTTDAGAAREPILTHEFYNHDRVQTLFRPNRFLENTWPFRRLWGSRWLLLPKDKKPSYLPPRVFALTVLDTAVHHAIKAREATANAARNEAKDAEAAKIEARVEAAKNPADVIAQAALVVDANLAFPSKRVGGLIQDALVEASRNGVENPAETFLLTLERSFNDAMDRVSGWYKRRTQLMIFVIALGVVGAINADSFAIGQRLFKDDALRASVVAQATKAVDEGTADCIKVTPTARVTPTPVPAPSPSEVAADCLGQVFELGLPLGWSERTTPTGFWEILGKVVGLFVTVLAILVGAPFWFDLLGKVTRLRGAGSIPPSTTPATTPSTPVRVVVTPSDAHDRQR